MVAVRAGDGAPFVGADRVDRRERARARPRDQEHAGRGLDERGAAHVGQRGPGDGDLHSGAREPAGQDAERRGHRRSATSVTCPPPQAENSVASVAPEATWQAPAQNRRRETGAFVSDIAVILVRAASAARAGRQYRGHSQTTRFSSISSRWRVPADHQLGRGRVIL